MKKILSFIFALAILISSFTGIVAVEAAPSSEKTRAIAIVFDNSGSMYTYRNEPIVAWCRATYAMEAFATMMNAQDTMLIYPMWKIEVGGKSYSYDTTPLKVTQQNASIIREIFTPHAGGTPIQSISAAYQGLQNTTADEKWLIVLTDGDAFSGIPAGTSTDEGLEDVLGDYVENVNVAYLGIKSGAEPAMPVVSGSNGHSYISMKAEDSGQVLSKLTEMCNAIFGRNTLQVSGKNITFDVSMSKLILFVQGEGIQNVSLKGAAPVGTDELKYSEKGCGNYEKAEDKTLQGVMLTYDNLAAGTYDLSYSGDASSVVAYYEPDVDISAILLDGEGNNVTGNEKLDAGTYYIKFGMVDRDGKETTSKLLGNTKYEITYSINGQERMVTADKADQFKIELQPNDVLDANFKVTYLNDYTLQRDSDALGWPKGGFQVNPPAASKLDVVISGGAKSFKLTELADGNVFRVDFKYDGQTLSGAQLDKVVTSAGLEGGNATYTLDRDDQGYYVKINYNGSLLDTDAGTYKLNVSGVYTNEDGMETDKATATVNFEIVDNSSQLTMELDVAQDYYQQSKIKDSKPIIANLTLGGKPLTDEQLQQVQFSATADGVKCIVTPLKGQSAYEIRFDPENPPENGKYELQFTATTQNEIGREVTAKASTEVEFNHWPMWLRILVPILIVLAIATLIFLFMNQKVLPKNISVANAMFSVDGEHIGGAPGVSFDGAGKKSGYITISSPRYMPNPLAKASMGIEVEAVSPRYLPSAQRRVLVKEVSASPATGVTSYKLGNANFTKDAEGKFHRAGAKTQDFKPFEFGSNAIMMISADVMDGDSGSSTVSFKGTIKFL